MVTLSCIFMEMIFIGSFLLATATVTLHVGQQGNDQNLGTEARPLKSFAAAQLAARRLHGQRVVVEVGSGVYRIPQTIVFTNLDSGDTTYRAAKGANVTFTGSASFKPRWTHYSGKILQCSVPADFDTDQLFINGERQILARYPNENQAIRILHGYAKDAIAPERVARWSNPTGGFLHAMHARMWGDFHYRILGKDTGGNLQMEGGWQNNRPYGMHPEYQFVEGIFEELDSPGEWFLDHQKHVLYYYPRAGVDLDHCVIEGPRLRSLFEFKGVKGIKLQGFTFKHTTRTFMDNREPLLRSDWTIYRGGALHFKGAKDCEVTDSTLEDLGGNAVFVDGMNRNVAIRRCCIRNIGANGVAFVGETKAVRSPLIDPDKNQSYAAIDKAPGPKSEDYPAHCLVEDCLITNSGMVEKQSAGVEISMCREITVRHCSIYHLPRAGINIGDGCWGGHVIEGCDVFDTVLETGDHGSFNSWGRDRYWGLTDVDMNQGQHPELAELDTIAPIILRSNRWRCDHGWDIDLDDGSSRYIIQNNLCLNGGIKNREGFGRLVENNVLVANSFHPHVWFQNSGDVFRHNIVFEEYHPIRIPTPWGKEVDFNFLHTPGKTGSSTADALSALSKRDEHSLMGDAQFVDPEHGDFRVRPGSPALAVGFKNFEMSSFGVRPAALRAMAQHPRLLQVASETVQQAKQADWQGAHLKDLVDPAEISATGLSENVGVLVAEVKAGSLASDIGLEPLDVIQAVDGKRVTSVNTFLEVVQGKTVHVLTIYRQQHSRKLTVSPE